MSLTHPPRPAARFERFAPFLAVLPSLAAVAVFVYGFIAWTGWVSLTNWRGLIPDFRLVGLKNYLDLFGLARFHADLVNTAVFTLVFLAVSLGIGLLLAILLDQQVRREGVWRSVFLFPMALSFVVTGTVWRWIFNPPGDHGALPFAGWLTDPRLAIFAVIVAAVWQMSGFTMAMYLAGLRGVPGELREAARVDGASEAQLYRHVILPILTPITLSAAVILGHISLKIFDLVFVMTGGGPGYATDVPGVYMFVATFRQDLYGRGAAIAMIMLLLVAAVIVPYLVYTARAGDEA